MYRVVEGKVITITEQFLDDFDDPIYPLEDNQGPKVTVIDPTTKSIVLETRASVDANVAGQWECEVSIPDLDLSEDRIFTVVWEYLDENLATHKSRTQLTVEPNHQSRSNDLIITVKDKVPTKINFNLPFAYDTNIHTVDVAIYKNNEAVLGELDLEDPNIKTAVGTTTTNVSLEVDMKVDRFEPLSLMVSVSRLDAQDSNIVYTMWPITPQILMATRMLEAQINKADYKQVIPELAYTSSDLVMYLYRGLAMFNQLPPRVTDFWGTNMQGSLLDAWITCSSYYALAAQLKAEGAMAFDFSGQSINLNIDRSPSEEAALGRVETQINDTIKEYKKTLGKAGYFQGDGSIGGRYLTAGHNSGVLKVTNAPTTKRRLTRQNHPFLRIR